MSDTDDPDFCTCTCSDTWDSSNDEKASQSLSVFYCTCDDSWDSSDDELESTRQSISKSLASDACENENISEIDDTSEEVLNINLNTSPSKLNRIGASSDGPSPISESPILDEIEDKLCDDVLHDIVGSQLTFLGPWGVNPVTYLDYVGSGRSLKTIENFIREHVMPTYSNTHTEACFNAQQTTKFREDARSIIKEAVNATDEDAVIFTGSGATSAVNKLIHVLQLKKPLVLIGPYEHHSNILPWKAVPGAKVVRIRQTNEGLVDLGHLKHELKKNTGREVIGSFSAASNVTGILTDVNAVASLLHKYNGIALFDYACSAPYVEIDMNPRDKGDEDSYKDAVFISTHKFIGGPGTPGILVAKRHLFRNRVPHNTGGGTVAFVRREHHSYHTDIESREEGGTPDIIGSIRAGLVFKIKQKITAKYIMTKEEDMLKKAQLALEDVPNLIILGNLTVDRLPIFSFLVYQKDTGRFIHQSFLAKVINDIFGIQVRSGCACAGPYGLDLLVMSEEMALNFEKLIIRCNNDCGVHDNAEFSGPDNLIFKPGFVRLNIPYFLSDDTLKFVLTAVKMAAESAWSLLPQYDFCEHTGEWWFKEQKLPPLKSLKNVKVSSESGRLAMNPEGGPCDAQEAPPSYEEVLDRAKNIFADAKNISARSTMESKKLVPQELRWFMLPEEAADLLAGKQVTPLQPDRLPFYPEALAKKLGVSVKNQYREFTEGQCGRPRQPL